MNVRGRLFTIFSVLLILIALPALSWLYLNKGANWRRAGLAEMADKRPLAQKNISLETIDGSTVTIDEGDFVIASILNAGAPGNRETLNKLAGQFDHLTNLTFLYLGESNGDIVDDWAQIDCSVRPCDGLISQLFTGSANTALIDDSLYIRGVYDLTIPDEVVALVEHGAILFPVEKREKIELKRGTSQ